MICQRPCQIPQILGLTDFEHPVGVQGLRQRCPGNHANAFFVELGQQHFPVLPHDVVVRHDEIHALGVPDVFQHIGVKGVDTHRFCQSFLLEPVNLLEVLGRQVGNLGAMHHHQINIL